MNGMSVRTRIGLLLAAVLFATLVFTAVQAVRTRGTQLRTVEFSVSFPVMGTVGSVCFYALQDEAERAVRAVRDEFAEVERLCSLYDESSELCRLNDSAADRPFRCSDKLWNLLLESRRACEFSDGAFDISVKPLMDRWGFYRHEIPSSYEEAEAGLAEVRALTGLDKVVFDDRAHTVFFTVRGMQLDLGGIAKGYALDRAARAAAACGVDCGALDLGGNLLFLPRMPADRKSYQVAMRDPEHSGRVLDTALTLRGGEAVASSGNYERFVMIGGRRYGHIIDPRTGEASQADYGVSAVAPSATEADWLSTAVFIGGRPLAEKAMRELPGVRITMTGSGADAPPRP